MSAYKVVGRNHFQDSHCIMHLHDGAGVLLFSSSSPSGTSLECRTTRSGTRRPRRERRGRETTDEEEDAPLERGARTARGLMAGSGLSIDEEKHGIDGDRGQGVAGGAPLGERVSHGIALIAPAEAGVASNGPAAAEPAAVSLEAA